MSTKNNWILNTTNLVMKGVPVANFSEARSLAETYLVNAGGWVPVDPGQPDGDGEPADGSTYEQAAETIISQQFQRTVTLSVTLPILVTLDAVGSFIPGTSTDLIFTSLQPEIEAAIEKALSKSPIRIEEIRMEDAALTTREGGEFTPEQMQQIQQDLLLEPKLVDQAALATFHLREFHGLNSTWMANKLIKMDDGSVTAFVSKFTSTDYLEIDPTVTYFYVVRITADGNYLISVSLTTK